MNAVEATLGDLPLMALHAGALFTFDQKGNLAATNEPEPEPAPRLYAGLTRGGIVWHVRGDLSRAAEREVGRVLEATVQDGPLLRPLAALVATLQGVLERDAPVIAIHEGPAWRFPAALPVPEGVTAIEPGNVALLRPHFPYTAAHLPDRDPCFAIVADGAAVSVCYSARNARLVAEAGVDTIEAHRGRGYAPRVVAAWATAIRATGRVPLYSADASNLASRAVAHKLGLAPYGVDLTLT